MNGAETVTGDLADPDSLRHAMAGIEKVLLLSSPHRNADRKVHEALSRRADSLARAAAQHASC